MALSAIRVQFPHGSDASRQLDPAQVWSPQGLVNMHVPDMWGFLRFEPAYAAPLPSTPEETAGWPARRSLLWARFLIPDYMAANNGRLPSDLEELGVQLGEGVESGVVARDDVPGGYALCPCLALLFLLSVCASFPHPIPICISLHAFSCLGAALQKLAPHRWSWPRA